MCLTTNWTIISVSVIWLLLGCAGTSPTAATPPNVARLTAETGNTIALCGAGLSESVNRQLSAVISSNGARLTQETKAEVEGIILSDRSVGDEAKVELYERYLFCVGRIRRENRLPADASDVLQRDLIQVNWDRAGMFRRSDSLADINWIGRFHYIYTNTSTASVRCSATVRGVNKYRDSRETWSVGETVSTRFDLEPKETFDFKGEVGAPGYSSDDTLVGTDNWFSCTYL